MDLWRGTSFIQRRDGGVFPHVWFLKHPTVYKNMKALCFRVLHGSKPWVKYYPSFVYMFTTVSEISPIFPVHVHSWASCEWSTTHLLWTHSQVSLIFHVHIHSLLNCEWNITYLSYTCSQLKQFQYHLYENKITKITKSHKTNSTLPYVTHRWKEKKRKNKTNKNDCPPPQNLIFVAVKLTSLIFHKPITKF